MSISDNYERRMSGGRLRKLLAGAAGVLAALTVSACGGADASTPPVHKAADGLNGIYKTRLETRALSGALNGVWRLTLQDGGYTFNYTGRTSKNVIISGIDVIDGHKITLRDRSGACSAKPGSGGCRYIDCRQPATYTFHQAGQKLTFSRLRDRNTGCELPLVLASPFQHVHG